MTNSISKYFMGLGLAIALVGCVMEDEGLLLKEEEISGIEGEVTADVTMEPDEQADGRVTGVEPAAEVEAAPGQPALSAAYNGVCGSGYGVIDSHALNGGTVYLTYNGSTGKNCVVTIRNTPGVRRSMCAKVSLAFAPWNEDCGSYTTYAGPVYVYAPNECIDWGGSIEGSSYYEYNTHCD